MASIYPYVEFARSYFRRAKQVLYLWPDNPIDLSNSVAVFVHFDRKGLVGDHVLAYVRTLSDAGFSVLFVSNSGRQGRRNLDPLKSLCRAVIIRRNVGYDFGAIRETLQLVGLPRHNTQRLLIANDSVYGPLSSLQPLIDRADFAEADVWGATESWQHRYHLQSYFLIVSSKAMAHSAWTSFWQDVRPNSSKRWVVNHYEIGLTQRLLNAGLRCKSLWPYNELVDQVIKEPSDNQSELASRDPMVLMRQVACLRLRTAIAHRVPLNPTADLWRQLLQSDFPFLKIELLKRNPTGVPDITDWRSVVANMPIADVELIDRDLKQKIRNKFP